MSYLGVGIFGTLFGGSPFIRRSLTPCLILSIIMQPLLVQEWTPHATVAIAVLELICLALLAGFWLPPRFGQWGFRAVAAIVFLGYAHFWIDGGSSIGLFVYGLPCAYYALTGGFKSWRFPIKEDGVPS